MDNLIANCYRDFANRNDVAQKYLIVLGICFGLVNGSSRFFWGFLMDKFKFKILMSIISGIELIIAATFYFSVNYDILYVISVLLIATCIGGHFSIIAPLFNKIYGIEIGPQAYALCGIFMGLSNLSGPLLCKFFLKNNRDFLVTFLIGGCLIMIKVFTLLMFNEDEKCKLKDDNNQDNIITIDNSEDDNDDEINERKQSKISDF